MNQVRLYAERNGQLHALLRQMHDALREANPEHPLLLRAEEILCDVPNQKTDYYLKGSEWV